MVVRDFNIFHALHKVLISMIHLRYFSYGNLLLYRIARADSFRLRKLFLHEFVPLNEQADTTETYCAVYGPDLYLSCTELIGFLLQRLVLGQTVVVIRHQQNDQLTYMANIGSVIVVGLNERQVDEVVPDEKYAEPDYDQRRHHVLTLDSDVVTEHKPVHQGKDEVELTHQVRFEFVLELAELFGLCEHQQSTRPEDQTCSQNGSH